MINKDTIKNLGKLYGYNPEPRIARHHERLETETLFLKVYTMLRESSEPVHPQLLLNTKSFVAREIENTGIESQSGLGFLILSEDVLNVNPMGGTEYASIVNPNIYTFDEGSLNPRFNRESTDTVGAYCVWEAAIVAHEADAWGQYMLSGETVADKLLYLNDHFEGKIEHSPRNLLQSPISLSGLHPDVIETLRRVGINTFEDLTNLSRAEVKSSHNTLKENVATIEDTLGTFGLSLKIA